MKKIILLLFLTVFCSYHTLTAESIDLRSPDQHLRIAVELSDHLNISIWYKDHLVISRLSMGMAIEEKLLGSQLELIKIDRKTIDQILSSKIPCKDSEIRDFYNELSLNFKKGYRLILRAYDQGMAYRLETSYRKEVVVKDEILEWHLTDDFKVYYPQESGFISHYERYYVDTALAALDYQALASLPVLFYKDNGVRILVTEADLYDYPAMFLRTHGPTALKADFPPYVLEAKPKNGDSDRNQELKNADYLAKTKGERSYPWRLFIITDDDRELIENNLVYQLSSDLQLKDVNWIQPGLVAWDWWNDNNITGIDFEAGINTETYKYYIDFASQFGLEYIILDEGWSQSTNNVMACSDKIDVEELVAYGDEKGVGVILWVLWGPLDTDMDAILDLYRKWGVVGVKVDFMQRADQYMVNYYERVAKATAQRKMVVDFHGTFKPAGLRRAYPNVLSYEGLRGQEQCKWTDKNTTTHNLQLPFIRMVAGPMDYTPGAMDNALSHNFHARWSRPMSMGSRCHQLAMYIIYESPLQMLCDNPTQYLKEETTTRFISQIPTIWHETRALEASVGEYLVIARRYNDDWYIGAMTNDKARDFKVDCSFLGEGEYTISVMQDGPNTRRHAEDFQYSERSIGAGEIISIPMASEGGYAAIIKKKSNEK